MRFSGKVALITGGSRGIGRAIALQLAREGAAVAFSYVAHDEAARATEAELKALGARVHCLRADVARADEVDRLVKTTLEAFQRIDILVNNAGITRDTLLLRMSEADWDEVMATNLRGVFLCTQRVLRGMIRHRVGRIVMIGSVSGQTGNAGQVNYASSKAALVGFARAVAREVASRGITVNVVAPGFIETEIWAGVSQEAKRRTLERVPLGRTGLPEEVAEAVAFLASDAAGYITGQVLTVDGGMVMA